MNKLSIAYLHVGADKTGSSTIQKFLDTNRLILKQHGYCYPALMTGNLDDASSTYSHHLVGAYFSNNLQDLDYYKARKSEFDESEEKARAARYMERITQEIHQGNFHTLILSYEGFNSLNPDELHALKTYLLSIAEKVCVIYYLRPRFTYGLSAISQRISLGTPAWKYHPPVNYYRHRLLALESVFGKENMLVRRFSKEDFQDGDLITDFCYTAGLGRDFLEEAQSVAPTNASLSELAIRVGDAMVFLLSCVDGPEGIGFNKLFIRDLQMLAGRPYCLNELQRHIISASTKEDSVYVLGNYGIDLNDAPAPCDDIHPVISNEAAESVARYILQSRLPNLKLSGQRYAPVSGKCVKTPVGSLNFVDWQLQKDGGAQIMAVRTYIENKSDFFWGGDLVPVNLSYRWFKKQDMTEIEIESLRTPLPGGRISAGEAREVAMQVLIPQQDGNFILKLYIVQEFCAWFDVPGFRAPALNVIISGGSIISVSPVSLQKRGK